MSDIDVEPVEEVDDEGETTDHDDGGSAEIPVEATTDLPEGVDAPEYVLYGGKGGVGKTTMAAATALSSAADGTSTLVVSTDPAHSLSDTLDTDIPPRPTRIREEMPLWAAEIDPEAAMEEGMFGHGGIGVDGEDDAGPGGAPLGGLGELGDMLGEDAVDPLMGGSMPGADEAAAMRQLLEYLDDPRFDRVVIDTAPTGHTLRLLELPEMLDSMVGRLLSMREKFSGMMEGFKGMFGVGGDDDAEAPDLDELRDRIERLRAVLQDPSRTDFRVVMVPEEMSVVESERLVARLDEFSIPVTTVVVNRVMENLADVADVDPEWVVSPNLDDCEFCQRRWDVQQRALRRATDLFRGHDVKRVPLLADEVRGERALRVVAACLA
ncbi:ArsA family ATPase [Haloplanus aerogenes]|uniref:Arsenic-transporting ATPase n=1 Tax=Haloplanus aerogenes TaxID=660522 RepID=A0A3M0CXY3_9EURY|nr:TRC40/GET3/ArsA family transport-energizing ATPase [Haloplanus aerogenes]AZH25110.1 arsenic-transporting ATPase [Haloplanus aerogenes]RMB13667.1 arsenite-transporting ATPase [Haloplanus aerogenes]